LVQVSSIFGFIYRYIISGMGGTSLHYKKGARNKNETKLVLFQEALCTFDYFSILNSSGNQPSILYLPVDLRNGSNQCAMPTG